MFPIDDPELGEVWLVCLCKHFQEELDLALLPKELVNLAGGTNEQLFFIHHAISIEGFLGKVNESDLTTARILHSSQDRLPRTKSAQSFLG